MPGMELTGSAELDQLLQTLPDKVERKVLRQAVSAGATPILKAMRAKVKKRSGILAKSLAKKVKMKAGRYTATAIIGPRSDVVGVFDGKVQKPSRYAHLLEKGFIDESGKHVPAQPFEAPALAETQEEAITIVGEQLGEGIEREAAK